MLSLRTHGTVAARSLSFAAGLGIGLSVFSCLSSHALGAPISWSGNVGNWGVGANWVGGNVPGANDDATIDQANASVTLDGADANLRSFTLNKDTALLTVTSKTLKMTFGSSVTKGSIKLHGSVAGKAKLDFRSPFTVDNGGKLVMDAPTTAGDVELFGTLSFNLDCKAGSELTVTKGKGGKRSIFGAVANAGVWNINHDLSVDITTGGGVFNPAFNNTGGDLKVGADALFVVKGDDVDKCTFTMKKGATDNKLLTGKGTGFEGLTFDYQSGLIRNAADNARGGVTFTDCRLKLTSTNEFFGVVNGTGNLISTGVPGANQELYITGVNDTSNAKITYEGAAKFNNKGKISFNTRKNTQNVEFDSGGQQIENNGTVQTLGGGQVKLTGQVINNKTISLQTPTRFEAPNKTHVNAAGGVISFDAEGLTLELNNTMNNSGQVNLGKGIKAGTLKGVAKVTNKAGGKIQTGVANMGGLAPRPTGDTVTGDTSSRSIAVPSVLTFEGGLDCEPGSAIETALIGSSPLSFDWGIVDSVNGGLDLGGSSFNLFMEGSEPSPGSGFSFAVARSDTPILNTFDFGNGVSDTCYPIGGSGALSFRVDYNVSDPMNPGSGMYCVVLTAQSVPTPGAATLLGLSGVLVIRRKR